MTQRMHLFLLLNAYDMKIVVEGTYLISLQPQRLNNTSRRTQLIAYPCSRHKKTRHIASSGQQRVNHPRKRNLRIKAEIVTRCI